MKVAIVIASKGRPEELGHWLEHLRRQTIKPATMAMAVTSASDLPNLDNYISTVRVAPLICKEAGSSHQRNVGLSAVLDGADVVAFFDDDYVPSSRCIEGVTQLFMQYPDVVAANGMLLADGINSPGISYESALETVAAHDREPRPAPNILRELSGLYGCNMTFRASAIGDECFDERLPLYGWQEDIDFAARVGRRGRIVATNAYFGVHRGVKGARDSGLRLGYSQVANPLYLMRKGTMSAPEALSLMARNIVKNHVKALSPEPWIDRRGRCVGNWRAIFDVLHLRDDPLNILKM
jgi:GT2 family glycosyltransferase